MSLLVDVLQVLISLFIILCAYIKYNNTIWKRKDIPHLPPTFPWGNAGNPFIRKQSFATIFAHLHQQVKAAGLGFAGVVSLVRASIVVVDPEVIRCILAKDFQCFVDRSFPENADNDPLSGHLVALRGAKWKKLRAKLTPTFTSGKMRMMFGNVVQCGLPIRKVLDDTESAIEIKELFGCFTADVIGSCAFGLDCNSFNNKNSEFTKYSNLSLKPTFWDNLRTILLISLPKISRLLRLKMTNPDVERFFMKVVKETVDLRKSGFKRNDFMQLLVELMESEENPDGLTLEEVAAQAFIFFLAGFETSSTTGAFCMMELATNQEIQNKVRKEINYVLAKHGELTYEALQEMKYLGNVIDETLRKYPPLPFLSRQATTDYKIPNTNINLENGTEIIISTLALQRDPTYFPNPETFDPERFSDDNRQKLVPYTYLPFGEGPRICIGMRFGLMQTKIGLVQLLMDHKFTLNEKTSLPPVFDPKGILLATIGGIWLDVEKVQSN